VLQSSLADLPSLPRRGIVTVTAERRVLQQENHMGYEIKISIAGGKSRQQRSVDTAALFSLPPRRSCRCLVPAEVML